MNESTVSHLYPEAPTELCQLVLTGVGGGLVPTDKRRERRQVAETLARLRQLHDELNI